MPIFTRIQKIMLPNVILGSSIFVWFQLGLEIKFFSCRIHKVLLVLWRLKLNSLLRSTRIVENKLLLFFCLKHACEYEVRFKTIHNFVYISVQILTTLMV